MCALRPPGHHTACALRVLWSALRPLAAFAAAHPAARRTPRARGAAVEQGAAPSSGSGTGRAEHQCRVVVAAGRRRRRNSASVVHWSSASSAPFVLHRAPTGPARGATCPSKPRPACVASAHRSDAPVFGFNGCSSDSVSRCFGAPFIAYRRPARSHGPRSPARPRPAARPPGWARRPVARRARRRPRFHDET